MRFSFSKNLIVLVILHGFTVLPGKTDSIQVVFCRIIWIADSGYRSKSCHVACSRELFNPSRLDRGDTSLGSEGDLSVVIIPIFGEPSARFNIVFSNPRLLNAQDMSNSFALGYG